MTPELSVKLDSSPTKEIVYNSIKKGVRTISSSIRMNQECIGSQIQKGNINCHARIQKQ